MDRNSGTQTETSAERALADYATAKFRDYQARWAPVQAKYKETLDKAYADNSFERNKLKASSGVDTGLAFDKASRQVDARDAAAGVNLNSSAHKLRMAGMQSDRAASTGLAFNAGDQAIEDSYVTGLGQLMQLGRGKEAAIGRSMGDSARLSAGIAANDAELSARSRAGDLNAVGTAAGIGLGFARNRAPANFSSPMGSPNVGPQMNEGFGIPVN